MSKYLIWDCGVQVPAYIRKPKNPNAVLIPIRTIQEAKIGLKWYVPAVKKQEVTNA